MSPPILKVGDATPEQMAIRLFGRPKAVTSNIQVREDADGFAVLYQRASIPALCIFFAAFYALMGIGLWIWSRENFAAIMAMAPIPILMLIGIIYAINEDVRETGTLMRFEATSGTITIDSSHTFHKSQIEGVFDARGTTKSGGYRQATALVRKPEGLFMYRLLHQREEGRIRDDLVEKIARRLGAPCRVIDDIKFAEE